MDRSSIVAGEPLPRITLIVAAFNAAETLPRALDSVIRQRCLDWRIIVVDDGSIDATAQIASDYATGSSRITVIRKQNGGAGAARNSALPHVSTEYVGYLDSDDELAPSWSHHMLALMSRSPNRDIYSSDGLMVYANAPSEPVFGYGTDTSLTLDDLLTECRILGGGALMRTDVLRTLGGFNEDSYGEDYDLWLRALAAGYTHAATAEELYLYHRSVTGQKSEDSCSGYRAAVESLERLIESGALTLEQERSARKGIARFEAGPAMVAQRRFFDRLLKASFGEQGGARVMTALRPLARLVRPLRRLFARRS